MNTFLVALSLFVVPVLSIRTLTSQQIDRITNLLNANDTSTEAFQGEGIQLALGIAKETYDNIQSLHKLVESNNNLTATLSKTVENCGASGNSVFFIEQILFPIVQRLLDEMRECKKVVFPPQSSQHQYPQPPNRNYYPTASGVTLELVDNALYQELTKANQKTQGQTPNSFYVRK